MNGYTVLGDKGALLVLSLDIGANSGSGSLSLCGRIADSLPVIPTTLPGCSAQSLSMPATRPNRRRSAIVPPAMDDNHDRDH